MNSCYFNCLDADLEYIGRKIEFLQQSKENPIQLLDCLLDAATMLSVCESDYADNAERFREYGYVYKKLKEVVDCLGEYGVTVILPPALRKKLSESPR